MPLFKRVLAVITLSSFSHQNKKWWQDMYL